MGRIAGLRRAFRLALQRMRWMRLAVALGGRGHVHQHAARLDLHRKGRDAIFLKARLAEAARAMEFPVMPRADEVIAVERALAERSAGVIADIRDRPETPVLERNRERQTPREHPLHRETR